MTKLAGIREVLCAAVCLVGGLLLPQAASASTLNPGESVTIDFLLPSGSYQSFALNVGAFSGTLSVDFLGGLLIPNFTTTGAGSDKVNVSFDGTIAATITYNGSLGTTFDTSLLELTAYTSVYEGGTGVPDIPAVTPIPASLPLFLSGAAFLYGVTRRRKLRRTNTQRA